MNSYLTPDRKVYYLGDYRNVNSAQTLTGNLISACPI